MIGWLMRNELQQMCKDVVVVYLRYYIGICLWDLKQSKQSLVRKAVLQAAI
jgi:hypothetical protein